MRKLAGSGCGFIIRVGTEAQAIFKFMIGPVSIRHPVSAALVILLLWVAVSLAASAQSDDPFHDRRQHMIRLIEADVRVTSDYLRRSALDERVLDAMASVPRHEFVPPSLVGAAYRNRPLPIGHGQTISQPYIVAIMTDLLDLEPGQRVLEIGTGSGYQAAVLAEFGALVWSIEIIPELAEQAAERLPRLGYDRVETRTGDGYHGWPDAAPFDAIIVTAAASHVPPPLLQQLKPGARMIIPVGSPFSTQQLLLVTRNEDDQVRTRQVLPVSFVPLTGDH